MPFDSINFWLLYFPTVLVYWLIPSKLRNTLLLLVSFIFYGYWDARYLVLLLFSIFIDFFTGHFAQYKFRESVRKTAVFLSLFLNLSLLVLFKYFHFFVESFAEKGAQDNLLATYLVNFGLPIGISFYTFQSISYTLDVYNGRIKPTNNLLDFMLYVSFFPQLVAGPIEKARHLLPQLQKEKTFDISCLRQATYLILGGLVKKMFLAPLVSAPAESLLLSPEPNIYFLLCGGFLTVLSIYLDFSAYSDLARGTALALDIKLIINFKPYIFSSNPVEFWQNWHISLTHWIRDYLVIGTRSRTWSAVKKNIHMILVMLLVGIWHDFTLNWILFGLMHGLLIVAYLSLRKYLGKDFFKCHAISLKLFGFVFMFFVYVASGLLHATYFLDLPVLTTNVTMSFSLIKSWPVITNVFFFFFRD